MAADGVFALILFYSAVFGLRRGFYKEVVQCVALVVAILAAKAGRAPFGAAMAEKSGLPLMLAEVAAVVMLWVAVFFVVAVLGRLLLKKIRGKGLDDNLDEGAEAVADAIGGDTSKGPMTLLTDPIASKRGMFYWSDKIFGAGLGLLKGVVTGYLLFALVLYADRARGWDTTFARSIEASYAARFFVEHVEGNFLNTIPEYRIAKSVDDIKAIGQHLEQTKDPAELARFANDPRLKALREHPAVRELGKDPELVKAWEARDFTSLIRNKKVRALLSDEKLRAKLAAVEWEQISQELKKGKLDAPKDDPDESE